jgi:hypothetical protein
MSQLGMAGRRCSCHPWCLGRAGSLWGKQHQYEAIVGTCGWSLGAVAASAPDHTHASLTEPTCLPELLAYTLLAGIEEPPAEPALCSQSPCAVLLTQ